MHGSITFQNRLGTSVIDYAAVHYSLIKCVSDFWVEEFNEFSDHAPIVMSLHLIKRTKPNPCDCKLQTVFIAKWNANNKNNLVCALNANLDMLDNSTTADETVDNFTAAVNDIISPFCSQTFTKHSCSCMKGSRNIISHTDKPWFTDECKTVYNKYKYELRQFSKKNQINRLRLADARRVHKRVNLKLSKN